MSRRSYRRPAPSVFEVALGAPVTLMIGAAFPMTTLEAKTADDSSGVAAQTQNSAQAKELPTGTTLGLKEGAICGQVTTSDGYPRSHVCLGRSFLDELWGGPISDHDGYFALAGAEFDRGPWIAWSRSSRRIGVFTIPEHTGSQPIHVALDYGQCTVQGRAVDENGRGLEGQHVRLHVTMPEGLTIVSDPQQSGRFGLCFVQCVPAAKGVMMEARPASGGRNRERTAARASPSAAQGLVELPDLVLLDVAAGNDGSEATTSVRYGGAVRDAEGRPIGGAEVVIFYEIPGHGAYLERHAVTGPEGRWACVMADKIMVRGVTIHHPAFVSAGLRPKSL
jgi:hypothetical protein